MALFKNILIPHEIMKFEDEYLMLHCSREDFIKAPFDGKLTCGNTSCKLSNDVFDLYISNIAITNSQLDEVRAGQPIGFPIVQGNMAYILIKLYKNNSLEDMIKYLQFRDDTILIKPKEDKKEITKDISSSKKKSTNKKKK